MLVFIAIHIYQNGERKLIIKTLIQQKKNTVVEFC